MADKRPFAKIDTGYIMNPKWFQVRRAMQDAMPTAMPDALHNAVRAALQAHLTSILYSAQNQTDGLFPVDAIKALCAIHTDLDEAAITALFEVGLWINHPGGMAEVRDYLKHQTPAAEIQARSDAARKAAAARWGDNANRNASGNAGRNAKRNAEEKRREKKRSINPYSPLSNFDAFWDAYPPERKAAKKQCAEKFAKAINEGVPAATIINAAARYRDDPNRTPTYTASPLTWLNQQRWESGPLPARASPGQPVTTDRMLNAIQIGEQLQAEADAQARRELTA